MFESQVFGSAPRYRTIRGSLARLLVVWAGVGLTMGAGCSSPTANQTSSDTPRTTATFAYLARTTYSIYDPGTALQDCADRVIATHGHPSWQSFFLIRMTAVTANRWELTLSDVPVGVRVSFRVTDPNFCVEDINGRVNRNVLIDNIPLTAVEVIQDQPDFFFTIMPDGTIAPG